jgi:MFS family permease
MNRHSPLVPVGFFIQLTTMAFGRFAYTLILPDMMQSLGFTVTRMGALGTGIVLGYLINSLLSGLLSERFGEVRIIRLSVICVSAALFCLGFFSRFAFLFASSVLLGAGAAGSYIPLVSLLNLGFHRRGTAFGIITGGTGAGIMLCGYLVPLLLTSFPHAGYRTSWYALALINMPVFIGALIFFKGDGRRQREAPGREGLLRVLSRYGRSGPLFLVLVVYFLLGFAYIIYVTYFGAYAVREMGFSVKSAGIMWSLFGINLIYSGFFWGALSDRFERKKVSLAVGLLLALSVLLIIPLRLKPLFYLSTFLFGFTFMGFLTLIYLFIGSAVEREHMGIIFGASTLIHGFGQLASTFLAGMLRDQTGTFKVPLSLSLLTLLVCVLLITRIKPAAAAG